MWKQFTGVTQKVQEKLGEMLVEEPSSAANPDQEVSIELFQLILVLIKIYIHQGRNRSRRSEISV